MQVLKSFSELFIRPRWVDTLFRLRDFGWCILAQKDSKIHSTLRKSSTDPDTVGRGSNKHREEAEKFIKYLQIGFRPERRNMVKQNCFDSPNSETDAETEIVELLQFSTADK